MVTEDWRVRMVVPDKGDYQSVPLNPQGAKVADTWDPVKDQASGEQCRSYGAAAIMRVPGRLHIYWQDDNTLRIDADWGHRLVCYILATRRPRVKRQRGKDIPWPPGRETNPLTMLAHPRATRQAVSAG